MCRTTPFPNPATARTAGRCDRPEAPPATPAFILLYFQQVWSPSIWGWKRAPAAVADFRTRARQGLQTCFGGHGCLPAPTRPTQRLTRPNGGGIVGGSMAEEKMASSLLTVYQNPAGRRVYSRAAPGFFSLSFGPRAAKVGPGFRPELRPRIAGRDACPCPAEWQPPPLIYLP